MPASSPSGVSRAALVAALAASQAETATALAAVRTALESALATSNANLMTRLAELQAQLGSGGGTTPVPTLPAPTFSPSTASIPANASAGTVLFDISAVPAGATRSALSPNDGRFAFNSAKNQVIVGMSSLSQGSVSLTFSDTLQGATGSPQAVTLPVTITAAGGGVTAQRLAAVPMTGTGAPANSTHTFGHAFARGDVMPGDTLALRLPGGAKMALQVDDTANHWDDGSLRLAALHGAVPALANGAISAAELWREAPAAAAAAPLNLATALAGRTATIKVANGSNAFTFDCIAQIANFPARWFAGPMVSQTRMEVDVPMAAMGGTRGRLMIDLAACADGTVRVDYKVWNFFAFDAEGLGDAAYTVTVTGDGGFSFVETVPRAPLYTGWGHRLAWKPSGTAVTYDPVWIRPDTQYQMRSGLVANYDGGLSYSALLSSWAGRITAAEWAPPYSTRDIPTSMGGTGGNNQIGEVTEVQALWLATGSPIAQQAAMLQAEAGSGIPYHHVDRAHGYRYLNPVDRPDTRVYHYESDGYVRGSGLTNTGQVWEIDGAHYGDLGTTPYVLTARRMLLETVQGMASMTLMANNIGQERGEFRAWEGGPSAADTDAGRAARLAFFKSDPQARGLWVNKGIQARATGWHMRQMIDASLLLPASMQPHGEFWDVLVQGNYRDWNNREAADRMDQGECYGWNSGFGRNFEDQSGGQRQWPDNEGYCIAPWQQMFILSQDIRAAWARIPGAIQRVQFTGHFLTVLMNNSSKINRGDIIASRLIVSEADLSGIKTLARQAANNYIAASATGDVHHRTYGPDFVYLTAYGADYAQRIWSMCHQLADVYARLGVSPAEAVAAAAFFAQVPLERKQKIFIDTFENNPCNAAARIGTTRGDAAKLLPSSPVTSA